MGIVRLRRRVPNCRSQVIQILLQKCTNINLLDAGHAIGRQFTLFAPDGPTERHITAAVSSKDSFATGQSFDYLLFSNCMLIAYQIIFAGDIHLVKSQPALVVGLQNGYLGLRTTSQVGWILEKSPTTPWERLRPLPRLALRCTCLFILGCSPFVTNPTNKAASSGESLEFFGCLG